MSENQVTTSVACTQCGGTLKPEQGQVFLNCPYCGATVYLDKSRVVFHWSLTPTLDLPNAEAALKRWMSGNQTVKDLDKKSTITGKQFQYFPLWYLKGKTGQKEQVLMQPASATSVTELTSLNILAGDLQPYGTELDSDAETPTVPLEAALVWGKESHPDFSTLEAALVHVPIIIFKYTYQNRSYTAVVECATGKVFANIFPAKAEAPYVIVGLLTAGIFICLALIPMIMGFFNEGGVIAGYGICLGLGALAAPLLFIMALWVAAKI